VIYTAPEAGAEHVAQLFESHQLFAPDLIVPEIGNALWKKVRHAELPRDDVPDALQRFEDIGIEILPSVALLPDALELALSLERTVYDCTYLALAVTLACPLVTADRRFHRAVAASPLRWHIRYVEDM
jgi:predicted nucleic acid-binding protein